MSDAVAYFSRLELPMKLLRLWFVVATFPAPAQTSSAVLIPGLGGTSPHHLDEERAGAEVARVFRRASELDPGGHGVLECGTGVRSVYQQHGCGSSARNGRV